MTSIEYVDLSLKRNRMFLFIGEKFSGKSAAACSWKYKDEDKPVKLFDFDGRVDSMAKHYAGEKGIDFDVVGPQNMKDILETINNLRFRCPYGAVIFDSITSLSMTLVAWQMMLKGAIGAIGQTKSGNQGLIVPGWDEVNGETLTVSQILEASKLLPCDVIFTAHPVWRTKTTGAGKDMNVERVTSIVSFGMKLQSIIPVYFTEVWHFSTEAAIKYDDPARRIIKTVSDGEVLANTSLPIPPKIDWTDKKLYPYIQELIKSKDLTSET